MFHSLEQLLRVKDSLELTEVRCDDFKPFKIYTIPMFSYVKSLKCNECKVDNCI